MTQRPVSYKTKQGEAVLNYLMKQKEEYVTAVQIVKYFESIGCDISRTTVYRRLERLVKEGKVQKYSFDGIRAACFQYIRRKQGNTDCYHLKCESCGEIFTLECTEVNHISRHIFENHAFRVNNSKIVFYGKCEVCLGR